MRLCPSTPPDLSVAPLVTFFQRGRCGKGKKCFMEERAGQLRPQPAIKVKVNTSCDDKGTPRTLSNAVTRTRVCHLRDLLSPHLPP